MSSEQSLGRQTAAGTVRAHGVTWASLFGLATAWLISVLAARVGIPQVDPSLSDSPRPLETLGLVTAVLPVSWCAGALDDRAAWLTSSSRGPARLRAVWVGVIALVMLVVGAVWVGCLPTAMPTLHAIGVWTLLCGCAVWAAVVLRPDLAVVGPLLVVVPFSIGGLVPFECNLMYNVHLRGAVAATGTLLLVGGVVAFALWGAGGARRP